MSPISDVHSVDQDLDALLAPKEEIGLCPYFRFTHTITAALESRPPIRGPVLKLLMYTLPKNQKHLGPSTLYGAGLPFGETPSPKQLCEEARMNWGAGYFSRVQSGQHRAWGLQLQR